MTGVAFLSHNASSTAFSSAAVPVCVHWIHLLPGRHLYWLCLSCVAAAACAAAVASLAMRRAARDRLEVERCLDLLYSTSVHRVFKAFARGAAREAVLEERRLVHAAARAILLSHASATRTMQDRRDDSAVSPVVITASLDDATEISPRVLIETIVTAARLPSAIDPKLSPSLWPPRESPATLALP